MSKQIYILGIQWEIKFEKDMVLWGECLIDQRVIRLHLNTKKNQQLDTILHEMMHAIWNITDLKDSDQEETTITRLATGLSTFFCDARNDWLIKIFHSRR